jgi:hypothetical protein
MVMKKAGMKKIMMVACLVMVICLTGKLTGPPSGNMDLTAITDIKFDRHDSTNSKCNNAIAPLTII